MTVKLVVQPVTPIMTMQVVGDNIDFSKVIR